MADDASRGANPAIAVDAAAPAPVRVADAIPPAVAAAIASAAGTPGPGTGTVTPALSEMQPEQAEHSLRVSLADLCAKGAAHYAHKSYEDAAEVYSRATEMQAEMNGEMSPANAEILFLYGRSLFKVGQSKSDVLGGKAPEAKKEPAAKKLKNGAAKAKPSSSGAAGPIAAALAVGQDAEAPQTEAQRITEEGVAIIAAGTEAGKEEAAAVEAKKPLFQFQGDDENWDESEEEEVRASRRRTPEPILTVPHRTPQRKARRRARKRTTWPSRSRSSTWRGFYSTNGSRTATKKASRARARQRPKTTPPRLGTSRSG